MAQTRGERRRTAGVTVDAARVWGRPRQGRAPHVAAAPAGADALAPLPEPGPLAAPAAAGTAEQAVAGYLTAEARGDFTASYASLSAADRATFPTEAAWVAAHADLPAVTAFAVEERWRRWTGRR